MPRVSTAHKLQRRNEILDAARACFSRAGFQGATIKEIIAEVGLSAGAVYSYFKNKRELVLAIAERRHEDERLALFVDDADPVETLKEISRRFLNSYLEISAIEKRRISLMTWSEALLDEDIFASVKEGVDAPRRALEALIARGQAGRVLRADIETSALACAMVAMLQGLVLQKLWNPDIDAAALRRTCDMMIEGLRP